MSAADISTAVTEAQAVLTLVCGLLRMSRDIPAERVFTLHAAVSAAIQRLADAPVLAVEGYCHFHHVHILH